MGFDKDLARSDTINTSSDQMSESFTPISTTTMMEKFPPACNKQQKSQQNAIVFPVVALCVPMALISGLLLSIVFKYQVDPGFNLFPVANTSSEYVGNTYIIVNFSSTQIAFLADLTSTVAPLLAGSLMSLASVILFRRLREPQDQDNSRVLPTPHQVSLLIGILAASYEQLWKSLRYLYSRRRKTPAPPILWHAVTTLFLSIVLGIVLTAADAVFHTSTVTASLTLYSIKNEPPHEHGRGLNALCANFDRVTRNLGFPCTTQGDSDFADPNSAAEKAESQYLAHNTSQTTEIRYAPLQDSQNTTIAYLIPKPSIIGSQTDYRATTIGVSAQCELIPQSECNITHWGTPDPIYTNFNCSSNFYGVLGMPPNVTSVLIPRQPSPYISFLSVKPQSNLQYAFFSDVTLEDIYNPAGLNDSGFQDGSWPILTNEQLENTIYVGFAWRTTPNSFLNGSKNEMVVSNLTGHYPKLSILDYFLNCKLQAYDVEYVWFNQSLSSISATLAPNGTYMNMWQGSNRYVTTVTDGGVALQDINVQSAIAGSTINSYTSTFNNLLSRQILSTIGGYTSGRQVLQQQNRDVKILTKVPRAALAILVCCSLIYPTLGLVFLLKARRMSHEHTQMAPLFSNWGLASSAWNENEYRRRSTVITAEAIEACEKEEKVRLYITRTATDEYRFAVYSEQHCEKDEKAGTHVTSGDIGVAV